MAALGILAVLSGAPAVAAPPSDEFDTIELSFFNGEYENLDQAIAPVRQGGMTIEISSPEHAFTVYSNRLELAPADADGVLPAAVEVDFEARGRIVARISAGKAANKMEDQVEAPRQTVWVEGRVRLEAVDGVDKGYLLTLVERPPTVEIIIRSQLGQNVVGLCQVFEKIPFVPVNCSGLDRALSVVTVPLPEPGKAFLVRDEILTDDERAFFERHVQR